MNAQELWQTALEQLREHMEPAASDWFAETAAFSLVDDMLVVGMKTIVTEMRLERYKSVISAILADTIGRTIKVEYVSHPSWSRLFETGKLVPDLPSSRVTPNLDVAKILILLEKKETSYSACAPDIPQSYVIGSSREEVLQRLRKAIQEQLSPLYEEHVPVSLPHITAAYLDLTLSE